MSLKDLFIKPTPEAREVQLTDYANTGLNIVNFHSNSYMSLSAIYSALELFSVITFLLNDIINC